MKILRLTLENINSLAGKWEIDFTSPCYADEGIFAIVGPTGSGKSTLLDVICLALYGRTPRLDRVNASQNELMNHQCGSCSAELLFATAAGTYLATWSQRRARDQATGKLQAYSHQLAEHPSGKLLSNANRPAETAVKIAELCGMDFERFTRSVLLAQGQFAAFLHSSDNDRSALLEDITGTTIYSDISTATHERLSAEKGRLQSLRDKLEGVTLLTDEQRTALQTELDAQRKSVANLRRECTALQEARQWLKRSEDLDRSHAEATQKFGEHQQAVANFKVDRDRLTAALRAAQIDPIYRQLEDSIATETRIAAAIQSLSAELAARERQQVARESECQNFEIALRTARKVRVDAQPVIVKAEILRDDLETIQTHLRESAREKEAARKELSGLDQQLRHLEEELQDGHQKVRKSEDFLHRHPHLAHLESRLSGMESRLEMLTTRKRDLARLRDECKAARKIQSELEIKGRSLTAAAGDAGTALEKVKLLPCELHKKQAALAKGQSREELRAAIQTAQNLVHIEQKFIDLAGERAKLVPGESCPLCGSREHPLANHKGSLEANLSAAQQRLEKATAQWKAFDDLTAQIHTAQEHFREAQSRHALAAQRLESHQAERAKHEAALGRLTADLQSAQAEHDELAQTLASLLAPYQLSLSGGPQAILSALNAQNELWQEHTQRIRSWAEVKVELETKKARLGAAREGQVRAVDKLQTSHAALVSQQARWQKDLQESLAGKTLEKYLSDLDQAIDQAQQVCDAAQARLQETRTAAATSRAQLELQVATQKDHLQKQKALAELFQTSLTAQKFDNESAFLAARLTNDECATLQRREKELETQGLRLRTTLGHVEKERAEHHAQPRASESLANLEPKIAGLADTITNIDQQIGSLRRQIEVDEENRAAEAGRRKELKRQEAEVLRWARLHDLIGSSDGKRFRSFAQGLTFELMVRRANQQLAKMTERYQLRRDPLKSLELQVIDAYQASEIRSIKNLSGGESFLVSLALALGLSAMSSDKVRVDSLFLDEGFGTLDEETLDVALSTLATLNNEGRLIGIISHVHALKQRVTTQITLVPRGDGTSLLKGKGVTRRGS